MRVPARLRPASRRPGLHPPKPLLGVLLVAAVVLVAVAGPSGAELDAFVERAGVLGPVAFVVLCGVLVVAAVPGTLLCLAAGVAFGPVLGGALAVLGTAFGATLAFAVARWLLHDAVMARVGPRLHLLDARLAREGLAWVLALRLMPLLPFNVLNYAFGVTDVRARDYVLGTLVGNAPAAIAIAVLGARASEPTSPAFLLSAGLLTALAALSLLVPRLRRRAGAHR